VVSRWEKIKWFYNILLGIAKLKKKNGKINFSVKNVLSFQKKIRKFAIEMY